MKIVMVANWWYRRGGLGAVMLDETQALERMGHTVIPFAARHPDNLPTAWERYFPPFHETQSLGAGTSVLARARLAVGLINNREAATAFDALLRAERPDLIHVHNAVRQLSPSILTVANQHKVPAVMTLHDYALVCPQGQMYKAEREACSPPNCLGGNVLHAITNRCVKRSTTASAVAAVENLVHRSTRAYTHRVELLLAPSEFLCNLVAQAGASARKLRLLPNGVEDLAVSSPPPHDGGNILYAGRLSREKGVEVLLEAASLTPEISYVIAGDGPFASGLSQVAPPNVTFVGLQQVEQMNLLYHTTVAQVVPSTWYENAPLAVIEAMRASRPVIATAIGGHPEMLRDGGGLLVQPGHATALADAVRRIWRDRDYARDLGAAGRAVFEQRFRLEHHMHRLLDYYAEAMA